MSLNSAHGEVYPIQHYVIKFVSDLRQIGGFLRFPPPTNLTAKRLVFHMKPKSRKNDYNIEDTAILVRVIRVFQFSDKVDE